MRKEHFPAMIIVLSRSIGHAGSLDQLFVISKQIDQAGEDFKYFNMKNMDVHLSELREQLLGRIDEMKRETKIETQCGTYWPS